MPGPAGAASVAPASTWNDLFGDGRSLRRRAGAAGVSAAAPSGPEAPGGRASDAPVLDWSVVLGDDRRIRRGAGGSPSVAWLGPAAPGSVAFAGANAVDVSEFPEDDSGWTRGWRSDDSWLAGARSNATWRSDDPEGAAPRRRWKQY